MRRNRLSDFLLTIFPPPSLTFTSPFLTKHSACKLRNDSHGAALLRCCSSCLHCGRCRCAQRKRYLLVEGYKRHRAAAAPSLFLSIPQPCFFSRALSPTSLPRSWHVLTDAMLVPCGRTVPMLSDKRERKTKAISLKQKDTIPAISSSPPHCYSCRSLPVFFSSRSAALPFFSPRCRSRRRCWSCLEG